MKNNHSPIPLFKVFMADDAPLAVAFTLKSGFIGQGPRVEEFEKILRFHFDTPWVNAMNSATSGLELAVRMAKSINPDGREEVLTTPLTCTATNWAILAAGVKLRWVDVDPATGNMDMDDLNRKINPNTLAIMVVHWGGYPCELSRLRDIKNECEFPYGIKPHIIEDCAHAWGSTYKGKPIGTHGNTSVFSFQAIKALTTGDGGCMISPTEEHYKRAKLLRWYGMDRNDSKDFRCQQNIQEWGFKFHMNDIAASIGISNYPRIDRLVKVNQSNGRYYNEHLAGVPGVTLLENKDDRQSSYWLYTILVERRNDFVRKMQENGIAVSQVHARNDKHDCVREFRTPLPNLDWFAERMICIPVGWWVTPDDREYIVECIKGGW
jgi:dTDP-4-amino-4,6-dideoxygalactose transaminase